MFFVGFKPLPSKRKLLAAVVVLAFVAIALTALTAAVLNAQQNIPATGTIQTPAPSPSESGGGGGSVSSINLDIYVDAAASESCTGIEWGSLIAGQTVTKTIYLKNTGNTAEVLSMTATGWTPASAGEVLMLTWNKEGASLAAGAVMPATLTLQVPADPGLLTAFSLTIVISGTAP